MADKSKPPKELRGIELDDPCPFCGGKLAATLDANDDPDGIVHSLPWCEKFEKLTPEQYIIEREAKLGRRN